MRITTKEYKNGICNHNVVALGLGNVLPICNKMFRQITLFV